MEMNIQEEIHKQFEKNLIAYQVMQLRLNRALRALDAIINRPGWHDAELRNIAIEARADIDKITLPEP